MEDINLHEKKNKINLSLLLYSILFIGLLVFIAFLFFYFIDIEKIKNLSFDDNSLISIENLLYKSFYYNKTKKMFFLDWLLLSKP